MNQLFDLISKNSAYQQAKKCLSSNNDCFVDGLWGSSWAYFTGAIASDIAKQQQDIAAKNIEGKSNGHELTMLFVTNSVLDAEECYEDASLFLPGLPVVLPPLEIISNSNISDDYSRNISMMERMKVLHMVTVDNASDKNASGLDEKSNINFIVASIHALLQGVPSSKMVKGNTFTINVGNEYKQEKITEWLIERGFERVAVVESQGEFSIKGCIVDVYPYSPNVPYRMEFFGDEVESIREFNTESQTSVREVKSCVILAIKDSKSDGFKSENIGQTSIISHLPKDTIIILKNESTIEENARSIIREPGIDELTYSYDAIKEELNKFRKIYISTFHEQSDVVTDDETVSSTGKNQILSSGINGRYIFNVTSLERFSQGLAPSIEELKKICSSNKMTVVYCNNQAEEHRFNELLDDHGINNGRPILQIGRLNCGFQFIDLKITLLSYNQIFKRYEQKRIPKDVVKGKPIDSFLDLKKGDYVVHVVHGIARFRGIKELDAADSTDSDGQINFKPSTKNTQSGIHNCNTNKREYLFLEFAEKTMVYVPATNIDLVQKYIGPSEHKPKLSKIGSKAWEKKKESAMKSVKDMANELLSLQAIRGAIKGIAGKKDDEWQREFEAAFIYQETEDQLIVANDIKKDIESSKPMDRLVCGDVGYGKTELAMRAAFKVVMSGRQVAVLVPTTILAQQHYRTFTERMADYPIRIDTLSRFRTKKEQKDILQKAAEGSVDIVIGTHRLVQKDVFFKNIGLVVIDEEQKFGVEHKEKFKKLRHIVDVLTLTATPIPRTLHMAMLGLRDISALNTPPPDRKSIQTRIIHFKPELLRQIIIHELNRNGQVYFVHNRVYNIERIAGDLKKLVPEARIVVGHGQMHEKLLEQRMLEFVEGNANILVSTTIIESGLDIPNVNTILINDAHTFGLADLHQLRGRVGRYKHRAYAYLIIPYGRPITPEAEKKVKAIEEFSSLGAGFKIALRDLEIRGAGNFLGGEQHGYIAAVGYEMYCRLLDVTVKRMKNMPLPLQIDVSIHINLSAYIPDSYISDFGLKMEIYRKLNSLQQAEDVNDIAAMLKDRFGAPPNPVKNLLMETEVRIAAYHTTIRAITRSGATIIVHHIDQKKAEKALSSAQTVLRRINHETFHLKLNDPDMTPENVLIYLRKILVNPQPGTR